MKPKPRKREKEGHHTIIKGSIPHKDITLISICIPTIEGPKYTREIMIDLKREIDTNRTIVWDSISYFQQWIYHPDKNSKGNTELKWYIRPKEPYTYVQKVPAKSIRKHILLKDMCNILQDRFYVRP